MGLTKYLHLIHRGTVLQLLEPSTSALPDIKVDRHYYWHDKGEKGNRPPNTLLPLHFVKLLVATQDSTGLLSGLPHAPPPSHDTHSVTQMCLPPFQLCAPLHGNPGWPPSTLNRSRWSMCCLQLQSMCQAAAAATTGRLCRLWCMQAVAVVHVSAALCWSQQHQG